MSSGTIEAFPAHNLQNATMSAPSPLAASSPGFPANIAETSDIPMSPLHEGAEPFSPPSISIQTPLVTRYGRAVRQPAIYRDQIPTPLPPAKDIAPQPRPLPRVRLIVRQPFETVANIFGLWRRYWHKPTYDPWSCESCRTVHHSHQANSPSYALYKFQQILVCGFDGTAKSLAIDQVRVSHACTR